MIFINKKVLYYFIVGLLFTSCDAKKTIGNQNPLTGKTISQDETKLPKEIFLMIGRGGCCNGHIVSISKNGEIKYFVGSYSIPNDRSDMPEIYDSQLIKQNPNYKPKYRKLSEEKINKLGQLINDEQKLCFKDEVLVKDDFVYNIYLCSVAYIQPVINRSHSQVVPATCTGNVKSIDDM